MPEPNFVSMAWVPESEQSEEEDDDKVYLFFSETAVEFDSYSKLVVPRVARVCKVSDNHEQQFLSGSSCASLCLALRGNVLSLCP